MGSSKPNSPAPTGPSHPMASPHRLGRRRPWGFRNPWIAMGHIDLGSQPLVSSQLMSPERSPKPMASPQTMGSPHPMSLQPIALIHVGRSNMGEFGVDLGSKSLTSKHSVGSLSLALRRTRMVWSRTGGASWWCTTELVVVVLWACGFWCAHVLGACATLYFGPPRRAQPTAMVWGGANLRPRWCCAPIAACQANHLRATCRTLR